MRSVLVLGANGFIGRTIQSLFKEGTPDLSFTYSDKEKLDVTDSEVVADVLVRLKPDVLIDLAAVSHQRVAGGLLDEREVFDVNCVAVSNNFKLCAQRGVTYIRFLDPFTGGSFDNHSPRVPYMPDSPRWGDKISLANLAGERALFEAAQTACPAFWRAKFKYHLIRMAPLLPHSYEAFLCSLIRTGWYQENASRLNSIRMNSIHRETFGDYLETLLLNPMMTSSGVTQWGTDEPFSLHDFQYAMVFRGANSGTLKSDLLKLWRIQAGFQWPANLVFDGSDWGNAMRAAGDNLDTSDSLRISAAQIVDSITINT